ncbi:MAG TPA: M48 family metalloprotease [Pyrinomonadaceae bacterium]|jgi:hypothetical protein
MKTHTISYCCALLILLGGLSASRLAAQENCQPPVALPRTAEPNIFNEEQEYYLGEAIAGRIQKDYRVIEDTEVTGYLARIGERLGKHLPLKLKLQFFLVDLPNANAFVLPGGRVYVSRKLVALAQSEDELAGVVAHELGHLVTHQSAIDVTRWLKEVLGVAEVADQRDIFEKYNRLMDNYRRKPEAFKSRESEKGELIADQVSAYAVVRAGYDPAAMSRLWERLTENKGKTGSWFSDLFGTTKPEERRLREMLKSVSALPAACVEARAATRSEEFKAWQSNVISYTGLGRRESLHGVLSKQQLSPPLRSDITHIRFSPDGKYVLAQDESGISVLSREPFVPLFRIEAPDARPANFTPDSQSIVFYTNNLRVEYWSVAEQKMKDAKEIVLRKGCMQSTLSPDGKLLACLTPDFNLDVLEVATGTVVVQKKEFYEPAYYELFWLLELLVARSNSETSFGDLQWIKMGFSPDGRYLLAGYVGRDNVNRSRTRNIAEVIDLTTRAKVPLNDMLERLIAGGFAFLSNDRLAGVNREDFKKSAILSFPEGKVLSELSMGRAELAAPTRGNYLFLRPIKDYALGVMDLNSKVITKASERAALDIFDQFFVSERRNGELGLYRMEKDEVVAIALLSNFNLGRLNVAELSRDMKWLALSGRERGGVWKLTDGEAVLYLRGFRGGHLSDDGFFYGDFPKFETAERNIARFNLKTGEVTPGQQIEAKNARQIGPYLVVTKSAKTNVKEDERVQYDKNVLVEMLDARSMTRLWTKTFPKEAPRVWVSPQWETVVLLWNVTDEAAKAEIKSDPRLSQQLSGMKEKEGDYFIQILDARDGNALGRLLIETGKGSFRLSNIYAAGDWVIVADTLNRVLVYSLKTGEQKGRVFGGYAAVSRQSGLLCVENEIGKLAIYSLETLEKRDQFTFSSPISLIRFSEDGQRLFVLTGNQIVYLLDVSAKSQPSARN